MTDRTKKVVLVVDNPIRDLEGLTLLARHLAERGVSVFLTPMYVQGFEVPAICPDLVVMNYARKANADLIASYKKAGIAVAVLDTEGGVWESPEQYLKSVDFTGCGNYIDRFYLWGQTQQDALQRVFPHLGSKAVACGSPRFDYYHHKWQPSLLQEDWLHRHVGKNYLLVISNFSLAYPKFTVSRKAEIENMVAAGYEFSYATARMEDDIRLRKELIDIVKRLSSDFPDMQILLRNHPFEKVDEYELLFKEVKNVTVSGRGNIASVIRDASVTIHFNSSVAVDCFLMQKPVLSLDWLCSPITKGTSLLPAHVSLRLTGYDHLKRSIADLFAGREIYREEDFLDAAIETDKWFYPLDGLSGERIANDICDYLGREGSITYDTRKQGCTSLLPYGSRPQKKVKGIIDFVGRYVFGGKRYGYLRSRVFTKNIFLRTKTEKEFDVRLVNSILDRLEIAVPSGKVKAFDVVRGDVIYPRIGGSSVKVCKC